jgi:hypothetical protein
MSDEETTEKLQTKKKNGEKQEAVEELGRGLGAIARLVNNDQAKSVFDFRKTVIPVGGDIAKIHLKLELGVVFDAMNGWVELVLVGLRTIQNQTCELSCRNLVQTGFKSATVEDTADKCERAKRRRSESRKKSKKRGLVFA